VTVAMVEADTSVEADRQIEALQRAGMLKRERRRSIGGDRMRRQPRLYSANRGHFGNLVVVSGPGNEGGPFLRLLDLRLDLINHNPTGFEWGNGGSGPARRISESFRGKKGR
jgi:hypothetical protein